MDSIINSVKNLKIYDSSMFHMEEILEKYNEYLKKMLELDPKRMKYFLLTIKSREIVNNQETEFEGSFLYELYQLTQKKDSIEITMKHFEQPEVTKDDIKKIHRVVIKGSPDDLKKNYDFRSDNDKWIGTFGASGDRQIDYVPPDYRELDELLDIALEYLNNENKDIFQSMFLDPLIAHALIAYIQPFGNGNTRLARVLQHCKFWKSTNKVLDMKFDLPTFYLSKNYLITRGQYRRLLKNIIIEKNDDSWNRWFKYNLNMIDDQLYFLNNQLTQYSRMK